MTEKKFGKLINEIQTFMWLDNWQINYKFEDIDQGRGVVWRCDKILYSYFKVYMTFNPTVLEEIEDEVLEIIFHEFSHIYTTQSLTLFHEEEKYIIQWIGDNWYCGISEKMHILNEQQTELLSRRFKELYLKSK